MGQIKHICEFGVTHSISQCRCIRDHVEARQIECDSVEEHAGKEIAEAKQGEQALKALRERLEESVDAFFGAIIMPVVKESFLDKLEQDVSDWLIEAAAIIEANKK